MSYLDVTKLYKWFLLYGLYFLVYCYYAVTCHRIILLDEKHSGIVIPRLSFRLLRFFGWFILLTIMFGIFVIPFFLLYNFSIIDFIDSTYIKVGLYYSATVPALYIFGRLSLLFPAIALDERPVANRSWDATKHNGWRMFVVVGILPIVFPIVQRLVMSEESSVAEDIALMLLYLFFLIIEVAALSLSYKYLVLEPEEVVEQ